MTDLDENQFSEPVNMDQLKKFTREIVVEGWVAIISSSHILFAYPYIDI